MSQIEASQMVEITIKGVPAEEKAKIDAIYPVRKDGTILMAFVGKIEAAGKTYEQLSGDIERAFVDSGIYVAPEIQVSTPSGDPIAADVIYLGGQVRTPGPIKFTDGMTLWKAIQAAGGATEFGSMKRVNVYRNGERATYDLTKKEKMEIPLESNDTVEVPSKISGCP